MTVKLHREDTGKYIVLLDGVDIGEVYQSFYASHIRRGRAQTKPWWQARHLDGTMVVVDARDAWQTRKQAFDALIKDRATR